jgi:hypothetical protein
MHLKSLLVEGVPEALQGDLLPQQQALSGLLSGSMQSLLRLCNPIMLLLNTWACQQRR